MTIREYNLSVDAYADRLLRFVVKSVKDVHFAQDIVQDCYEKLWNNVNRVNGDKVKAYLFTTAYHSLIDRLRKEKRIRYTDSLTAPEASASGYYSDVREIIDEAADRLPDIQRLVLILRDYESYTYEEIGNMTGLNESQVKVYIYRARVFLKNYIRRLDVLV